MIVYRKMSVSVPSFGDSFFINAAAFMFDGNGGKFPSPHSGILFLYVVGFPQGPQHKSFRPLIRGFFFYGKGGEEE